MRILFHLGLNKCASTYIQRALDRAHANLRSAGVWYPWEAGTAAAHYGLSRHYGFGPMADDVMPVSLADLIAEARLAGCERMILSSEYLSLYAPRAVARLMADIHAAEAEAEFLLYSRPIEPWVRSLFNQYVKTVDGGQPLANIDAFARRVLTNGALDLTKRIGQWQHAAGNDALSLYRIEDTTPADAVLAPIEAFAGISLTGSVPARVNASLDPDRLHAIGVLRQQAPSPARERALSLLLAGRGKPAPAPAGYLDLSDAVRKQLSDEIAGPAQMLPWRPLDAHDLVAEAA